MNFFPSAKRNALRSLVLNKWLFMVGVFLLHRLTKFYVNGDD